MSQPNPYNREFNFSNYQASHPADPLPAVHLDAELSRIKAVIDQIRTSIAYVQRDDFAVANDSIGLDQLKAEVVTGLNPPTTWATATNYVAGDTVFSGLKLYSCLISHVSGVFATDLAASKWYLLADFTSAQSAALVTYSNASSNLAATDVQAAIDENVTHHVAKGVGTYTAVKADNNRAWRFTGAGTINLTAAATLGDGWKLWVRANGGAVTIDPNGAETIDGAATIVIPDGAQALVLCTGTTFFTMFNTSVVNATTIGATTPGSGAFTTLTTSGANVFKNAGVPLTVQSDDPGAVGPTLELYHNSASSAASDTPAILKFSVNSSTGVKRNGGQISTFMTDPTNASEDVDMYFTTLVGGAAGAPMHLSGNAVVVDGILSLAAGSAGAPSMTFTADLDSGMYRIGANTVGFAVNGAAKASLHVNGFTVSATQFDLMGATGSDSGVSLADDGKIVSYMQSATGASMQLGQNNSTFTAINFIRVATSVGTISCSAGATAYNTSSDKTLKQNFRPFDSGAILDALEVGQFEWIAHPEVTGYGVLAQDAYEVFPQAITQPAEDTDNTNIWSADYSKFVPLLMAEIKSLRVRLAAAGL